MSGVDTMFIDTSLNVPFMLVASPYMCDSVFKKSVVLVLEHNDEGAFGLIINKPSGVPLNKMLLFNGVNNLSKDQLSWVGGPVINSMGLLLCELNSDYKTEEVQAEEDANVSEIDGKKLLLSGSMDILLSFLDSDESDNILENLNVKSDNLYPYKYLLGHSSWVSGQLEKEIGSGDWLQAPVDFDLVFNTHWEDIWDKCVSGMSIDPTGFAPVVQSYLN